MNIAHTLFRSALTSVIACAGAYYTATPVGAAAAPLIHFIAQSARAQYQNAKQPIPWYLDLLP